MEIMRQTTKSYKKWLRKTIFRILKENSLSSQYGGTKMLSHGSLRLQKSYLFNLLCELFYLRVGAFAMSLK